MSTPTGNGPTGSYCYNPVEFATPQTAQQVAQMLGGTVVQASYGGAFQPNQTQYMVQLADGRQINPGLVAQYYCEGMPQQFIDQAISC